MLWRYHQARRERRICPELEPSLTARRAPDEFLENWRANFWLFDFNHGHTFLAAVMYQDTPACGTKVLYPVGLLKTSDEPALPLVAEDKHRCRAHDAAF